jgi:hypothetical protein
MAGMKVGGLAKKYFKMQNPHSPLTTTIINVP